MPYKVQVYVGSGGNGTVVRRFIERELENEFKRIHTK